MEESSENRLTWGLDNVEQNVADAIKDLGLELPEKNLNFHDMQDEELREKLAKYGASLGYLGTRRAYYDSSKLAAERILNGAVSGRVAVLERTSDKKRLRDSMEAEVIRQDSRLKELNRTVIELEAICKALEHIHNAFDICWKTVSRLLASRGEEVKVGVR